MKEFDISGDILNHKGESVGTAAEWFINTLELTPAENLERAARQVAISDAIAKAAEDKRNVRLEDADFEHLKKVLQVATQRLAPRIVTALGPRLDGAKNIPLDAL